MLQAGELAELVRTGLAVRSLPPVLFYDAAGSALFEQITTLPEYYLTRAETELLQRYAPELVALGSPPQGEALLVAELGAGSATKSEILLEALSAAGVESRFVPCDVSPSALDGAQLRLQRHFPRMPVLPIVGSHFAALAQIAAEPGAKWLVYLGSSIGNYEERDAVTLLAAMASAAGSHGAVILGTDLRKAPAKLLAAYDDAAGVTAQFNLNVLRRINRELGGEFDLDRFVHRAVWNDEASRIEMYLESSCRQDVCIRALELTLHLERGERILTEMSHKYDTDRVRAMLGSAGLVLEHTFYDSAAQFGVHLARPRAAGSQSRRLGSP
jgi:L-histidine N-alpha-methyltransferase